MISPPYIDNTQDTYYVIINPQIPDTRNYFYVHATNAFDSSTIASPRISFTKIELAPKIQIVSATGEEEGSMEPTSLFHEELFEEYNLIDCKFSSNLMYNFIYCLSGCILM